MALCFLSYSPAHTSPVSSTHVPHADPSLALCPPDLFHLPALGSPVYLLNSPICCTMIIKSVLTTRAGVC